MASKRELGCRGKVAQLIAVGAAHETVSEKPRLAANALAVFLRLKTAGTL